MKFSYSWIRESVPDLVAEPAELERLITLKTAECEGIEPTGEHFARVIAARVRSVAKLPKGKNHSVTLDVGSGHEITVVCGAGNVRPGLLAAWIPPGTNLGGKLIERATIEGVESEGMLASGAELGVNRDSSGLLELTDIAPGQLLPRLRPDWIIEIDNKSLTHRPDLWGHHGIAREVAAITHKPLTDPVNPGILPALPAVLNVEVLEPALCPRYSALLIENVTVEPSPLWLQARLESVDLNAINNVVDITNYVLAELPQPMHAFDADKLHGNTVYVRRARAGERLRALNGETYDLTEEDLVIADAVGPVALAGVIGGADSAISAETTRIVLESANFQAASIRSASVRHKLRTDASVRFEKSLDAENTSRGLARALGLLAEILPAAHPSGGVADVRAAAADSAPIELSTDFVRRKLGTEVSDGDVEQILRSLGFSVGFSGPGLLKVGVPTWRATKDISLAEDLVEEVGRMIGYGEITPVPPLVASVVPPQNPLRLYLRNVRQELADLGFSEVYNYSFITAADAAKFHFDLADHVGVRNPIASEWTHLRRSLLPGLFKSVIANLRYRSEFRLFEIGKEVHPAGDLALPREATRLAAVIFDAHGDGETFFELKRVLLSVFPGAALTASTDVKPYEHPSRAAEILWSGLPIGRFFELHPGLLSEEGIEGRAVAFDVDLELCLERSVTLRLTYRPPSKYPTSGFDLSVDAPVKIPVGVIQEQFSRLAGDSLAAIDFVRQYVGPPLPEGQKSVSYHLEIGARDHTLTSDEVTSIWERIVNGMLAEGFKIRGLDKA